MPRPCFARKGKEQRFYARNALKTMLDRVRKRLMRLFWGTRADFYQPSRIHPALSSSFDEGCRMAARLIAYVGTLALLAIVALHQWNELRIDAAATPAAPAGWSAATRSYPAFAISQSDFIGKTETYEILRHPEGGRKDVMRWVAAGENPVAELEIYRRGGESNPPQPPLAELANRVDPGGGRELEAAGVIDSKFGPVSLLRPTGQTDRRPPCLAFLKQIDDPDLRLSGWACQDATLPAGRARIGCLLNRLILLSAGNEPRLAELFARAELRRGDCGAAATSALSADWVTNAENPRLRGAL